jgi:hypothetical protein
MVAGCVPVHKFWVPAVPGWCINKDAYVYTIGAGNILTDLLMLGLSIPVVRNLGLSLIQKSFLGFIYLLGLFVSVPRITPPPFPFPPSLPDMLTTRTLGLRPFHLPRRQL